MRATSELDIHNIKANIEQARRSSDKWIGIGPFGIGLDGALTLVPVVGQLYTLGAAAYLLTQGVKASGACPSVPGPGNASPPNCQGWALGAGRWGQGR